MKKNVLILSSTPRKGGNSELLSRRFGEGATSAGHTVDQLDIGHMDIRFCTGCGSCFRGKGCPQKDDIPGILDKMVAADVLVLATPVYFYTMSAQMKTLIDRCCARYKEMKGKELYYILTAATGSREAVEPTVQGFRAFAGLLPGSVEKEIIYGTSAWEKGDVLSLPCMKEAYELGQAV